MIVLNRFRVPVEEQQEFREALQGVRERLAARPGHLEGSIGRNLDEPDLWVLQTRWENVGAYRRALSSFEGKMHIAPLLGRAVEEPSAYEVVEPGTVLNSASTRSIT